MGFLLLGIDSLIACFAVGALVSRRSWLSYAALFGVCDAGGFLLGTAFHWSIPDATANVVETRFWSAWVCTGSPSRYFRGESARPGGFGLFRSR